ncbi:unnamed protein product [Urochloa humidicola]
MSSAEDKIDTLLKEVKNLTVGQLKITETVEDLRKRTVDADKITVDLTTEIKSLMSRLEVLEALSKSASPQAPMRDDEGRANGHGITTTYQGTSGDASTSQNALVKGEQQHPPPIKFAVDFSKTSARNKGSSHFQYDYKLPMLDFPIFTGEHPRLWKEQCEKYFTTFRVPVELWAPYATINFHDNAAQWLLSYEAQHSVDSWPELCAAVEQKFGPDLYQNYMRDLLAVKQTADVLEYATRFEQAKHRVLVHNKNLDEVFLVQKFLGGLKFSISNAIVLHKPRTIDAALSLALMQEDVLESIRKFNSRGTKDFSKFTSKPTPPTPQLGSTAPLEFKPAAEIRPKWDNKLSALQAQRRAQGLCMKCGEKWNKQHRCPKQIPLHVLEEFLDAISIEEDNVDGELTDCSDEELLSLSLAATEGIQGRKSMRLQGLLQHQEILILVDYGSTHTFINSELVDKLNLQTTAVAPVQVSMANGSKIPSDKSVKDMT